MTRLSAFFHFWKVKENRTFVILMILLTAMPISLVALNSQQIFRNQAAAPKSATTAVVGAVNPLPPSFSYYAVIADGSGNFFQQLPKAPENNPKIDGPMTIEAWINLIPISGATNFYGKKSLVSYMFERLDPIPNVPSYQYLYSLDLTNYGNNAVIQPRTQWIKEDLSKNFRFTQIDDQNFVPNTWYHLASVFDGTQTKVYLNGKPTAGTPVVKDLTKTRQAVPIKPPGTEKVPLAIGENSTFSGQNLRLDEVRISKGVRDVPTNWEKGVYNSPLSADADTMGLWHFDQNGQDSSTKDNDTIAVGNVRYISHNPTSPALTPWKVEYFNNTTFKNERNGKPFKTEEIVYIDRNKEIEGIQANYGISAPVYGMQSDNFSVKFSKNVNFKAGTYSFSSLADDSANISLNSNLLRSGVKSVAINKSETGNKSYFTYTFTKDGLYPILVKFKETTGDAKFSLTWTKIK